MNVIIIDSGLSLEMQDVKCLKSVKGISIKKSHDTYLYHDDYSDSIGHGTILAHIMFEHLVVDVDLFIIKIIDSQLSVDVDLLIEALNYCDANLNCDLIQISLGTLYTDSRLQNALSKLTNKGVAIVSAFDNENCISYPAAYENVIGVDISHEYHSIEQFRIIHNQVIDIQGPSIYYRTKGLEGKRVIVSGSSFYCSYITALIANMNLTNYRKVTCLNGLEEKASEVIHLPNAMQRKQLVIRKAVVFPFNKEIHSLAAFEHLLGFEVQQYFDLRQKGLLHRKICDILSYSKNEKVINDFEHIDWSSDFDTLICGHLGEISQILGYDILEKIVEKCSKHAKQLICFDNITKYLERFPNLCVWYPSTHPSMVPSYRFNKLRSPNVPIIGVFGTSSRQGKMTVQLMLREAFKQSGVKVKNVGSEPESVLFGFEYAYVFGYESTDLLMPYEMVQVLNEAVYELEKDECELVIVGSQSGTVPHQLRSLDMIPYKQYLFLLGTQPDSIILCVNGFDSEEYIKRTIAFFQSTVNAYVICLIVSYVNARKKHVEVKPLSFFQETFGVPAFDLQNLNIHEVLNVIFTYYGR